MLRTQTTAAIAIAASLALPGTALAQSAGDNQYVDPLAGQSSHHHSTSSNSGTSGSGTSSSTSASTSTGSSGSSGSSASGSSASGTAGSSAANGRQLPRTGFELLIPIELGLALLLTGFTLRRVLALRGDER